MARCAVLNRALSENVLQNEGGINGRADLLAVVGGQHAGVLVSELVGDAFQGDAGVGHDRGGTVGSMFGVQPSPMSAAPMTRLNSDLTFGGSVGEPTGFVNRRFSSLRQAPTVLSRSCF